MKHTLVKPDFRVSIYWIIPAILVLSLSQCKFPYDAEVDDLTGMLVIEGGIIKGDSLQSITVSYVASLNTPEFIPVKNCEVSVLDENGNDFSYQEAADGIYQCIIPEDQLDYHSNYFVRVITSEGKVFESAMEELLPAAPVDSIYLKKEVKQLPDGSISEVSQFYLDLVGTEEESRYYMWKMIESYEYHSTMRVSYKYTYVLDSMIYDTIYYFPIDSISIDSIHIFDSYIPVNIRHPDSIYICWKTNRIRGLFSSSTINLASNVKKQIPLHYFSTQTEKLNIKYSLMVEQYSLTENAYAYWNRVKIETEETGGLYTQQPGQIESNIRCISDENEEVLGYFWTSSVSRKRIFVIPDYPDPYIYPYCELMELDSAMYFYPYDVYIWKHPENGVEYTTFWQGCMNCLMKGGVNKKPDFWDEEGYVTVVY